MKNIVAECVLLSPEEYVKLMDAVNDARLILLANERMNRYNPDDIIPSEEAFNIALTRSEKYQW